MEKVPRNPSSGLMTRNPTHVFEADRAQNQSDIVKSIKGYDASRQGEVIWKYDKQSLQEGVKPPMVGITKIRDMEEKEVVGFCKSLLRTRPNIYKVHIVLGEYPNQKEIQNSKTRALFTSQPRYPSEIAQDMGSILSDSRMLVTELIYEVTNTEPGTYSAHCKVYGVTAEEYEDDELFSPAIKLNFVKSS